MTAPTLTIRPAGLRDLAAIDGLLAQSYPALLKHDYPPSALVTALPLIARANPRLIASATYFVATDETGQIIGAGGWTWTGPQGGAGPRDLAHVRHVVTDHRRVRTGIGRALMTHVFETARAAGAGRLDCQSTLTAVPFYARLGFREIGPIEIRLRPGIDFPAVRMLKNL